MLSNYTQITIINKIKKYFVVPDRYEQNQKKDGLLPTAAETLTLSPNRIRTHHPKCPNFKPSNISSDPLTLQHPKPIINPHNHSLQNLGVHQLNTDSQRSTPDYSEIYDKSNSIIKSVININNNEDVEKHRNPSKKSTGTHFSDSSEQLVSNSRGFFTDDLCIIFVYLL